MRRRLSIAALYAVALFILVGQGQVTLPLGTTVLALPASRQGDYISPEATVPANAIRATLTFTGVSALEYENAANSLSFAVEMAHDAVEDWRQTAGMTWQSEGHSTVDPKTGLTDPAPGTGFDVRPWLDKGYTRIRVHLITPRALVGGITAVIE